MRNTTKLKNILLQYSVGLDLNEDEHFVLSLVSKDVQNEMISFEGKSYSIVISKAYSYFLKELKKREKELK
jgi:hypothetical protein